MDATKLRIQTPRWLLPALDGQYHRYIAIHGGRGSGKSHAVAEMIIEDHLMRPNCKTICTREVQRSIKDSSFSLLKSKIESMNAGYYFEVMENEIRSKKGDGLIVFRGLQNHTSSSIKSLDGFDNSWNEESQDLSQKSLDDLRPTLRNAGSRHIFTWNPRDITDPVDALFRGNLPPKDSLVIEVNYTDNPWFPKELRDEMEYDQRRDPDKFAHVWLGKYLQNSESRVFHNWRIEEFESPPDAIHRIGIDFGFAVDPTCAVRCHIVGRKLYIDYEVYRVGCEIVDTPELIAGIPDADKWPIVADSARPETISHLMSNGYKKIYGAAKGPNSVTEGVEWLKSFDMIVHPRCKRTANELSCYSFKTDDKTGKILPILKDKNNHLIDALRYACEGVRRSQKASVNKVPEIVQTLNYW